MGKKANSKPMNLNRLRDVYRYDRFFKLIIILLFNVLGILQLMANPNEDGGQVTGFIFDQKSKSPIEYATIAIYNAADSSLVTGTISDPEGNFYGYLITGWTGLVIKPVDEQTVRIYGLKGPPEYEDRGPNGTWYSY